VIYRISNIINFFGITGIPSYKIAKLKR